MKKQRIFLLSTIVLCLSLLLSAIPQGAVFASSTTNLVNGSFETGDYTGWTLIENNQSSRTGTWGIASDGQTISSGDYTWDFCDDIDVKQTSEGLPITYAASDGSYLAYQLQNGSGGHRMYQDITLSPFATTLTWDMWFTNWNDEFDPESQYLAVRIRDLSDNVLETLFISTQGAYPQKIPMTGFSYDISAYAGTTVRLDVDLNGNEFYFDAAFDNFSLLNNQFSPANIYAELDPGHSMNVAKQVSTFPKEVWLNMYLYETYSCPYLFTWDGLSYEKENDIYSVARGREREFTDYLCLQNQVVPKNGAYSFEIREVPGEQSHTDRLKLLTIDHSTAVSVGVDSSGNVHSYRNPSAPDSAVDSEGIDVFLLIRTRDTAAVDLRHRNNIVVDFSSIDISSGAKLIVRIDGFEGQAGGDPTGEVPAIHIQTQQSGEWVTRHKFFPKELAAEGVFDLKSYLAESKMVRLSCVSCLPEQFHRIDYIALDNTADSLDYNTLEPASAVLNGMDSVLSEVNVSDDVYAVLAKDDIMTVTFPFTPLTGEVRSFVLVSEGYYELTGQTYYVYTWDGSSWQERAQIPFEEDFEELKWAAVDLHSYLPDADDEFKVKIVNKMEGEWEWMNAGIDQAYLEVNGIIYPPSYARESDITDILPSVLYKDDDEVWDALNKWAILKFDALNVDDITDIWWQVTDSSPELSVGLSPSNYLSAAGGSTLDFNETISVANNSGLLGSTLHAIVTFYSGHYHNPKLSVEQKLPLKAADTIDINHYKFPAQGTEIGQEQISIFVGTNLPPTAGNDDDATGSNALKSIYVLANDTDPENDTLRITGVNTTGTTGKVTFNNTRAVYNPVGHYEYLDEGEDETDTFLYTISDDYGHTDTATVTMTINGLNDPPVAEDDDIITAENTPVTFSVLSNDHDAEGDTISISDIEDPYGGTATLNPDNTITLTPGDAYYGYDSLEYTITDGRGHYDTAEITVSAPDIRFIKRVTLFNDADGAANPGDTLKYTCIIENNGYTTASGIIFSDCPDYNSRLVAGSVTSTQGAIVKGNSSGDTTVEIELGNLDEDNEARISFEVKINKYLYLPQIANWALLQGGNILTRYSDDPNTDPQGDPTIMNVEMPPSMVGGEIISMNWINIVLPWVALILALVLAFFLGILLARRYNLN